MDEDTIYFAMKANLEERMNLRMRMNPTSKDLYSFWSSVQPTTIAKLIAAYKDDFMLFDYSPKTYLNNIGLSLAWK